MATSGAFWPAALVAVGGLLLGEGVAAADVAAGQRKSQSCAVCHGPVGRSTAPDAPHLAGQPELYLAAQLRNFRSGKRPHEVMVVIAKPLSDEDIADLSAFYSSL